MHGVPVHIQDCLGKHSALGPTALHGAIAGLIDTRGPLLFFLRVKVEHVYRDIAHGSAECCLRPLFPASSIAFASKPLHKYITTVHRWTA